jgi:hypothetical protein
MEHKMANDTRQILVFNSNSKRSKFNFDQANVDGKSDSPSLRTKGDNKENNFYSKRLNINKKKLNNNNNNKNADTSIKKNLKEPFDLYNPTPTIAYLKEKYQMYINWLGLKNINQLHNNNLNHNNNINNGNNNNNTNTTTANNNINNNNMNTSNTNNENLTNQNCVNKFNWYNFEQTIYSNEENNCLKFLKKISSNDSINNKQNNNNSFTENDRSTLDCNIKIK